MHEPDFMVALGLSAEADERAIRRAYAQRLKQIDQLGKVEEFQSLRHAYEAALYWVAAKRHHEQGGRIDDHVEMADSPARNDVGHVIAPEVAEVEVAAKEDIDTPQQRQQRLAQSEHNARAALDALVERLQTGPPRDPSEALELLHLALDDDSLMDMDARFVFEWGIASVLATGWRAGHEHLFVVAIEHFKWRGERTRLFSFGRAGHVIDAAIVELEMHETQPWGSLALQRELVQQLRLEERPKGGALIKRMPSVEYMVEAYPNWLHVVTHTANIARWRQWRGEVTAWERWTTRKPTTRVADFKEATDGPPARRLWIGGCLLVLTALFNLDGHRTPPAASPDVAQRGIEGTGLSWTGSGSQGSYLDAFVPPAAPFARSYGKKIRDAILPNIIYGGKPQGNPEAEVVLQLAADGQIRSRTLSKASGVPGWDAAVLRAIDGTGRLPPDEQGRVPPSLVISFRPNVVK